MFDWKGMKFLEASFRDNQGIENNWDFRYYVVEDPAGKTLLMTFAVVALHKEDMFSQVSISKVIEKEREINPYYLTSMGIILGTLFTEGNHLYIDRQHPEWKKAYQLLIAELYQEQEQANATNIMLRDLDAEDPELQEFMVEQDFVKIDLPESCVVTLEEGITEAEYLKNLSKKNRQHYAQKIQRNEHFYVVQVKDRLSKEELAYAISLFKNVKNNNFGINNFLFPEKLFHLMNEEADWEFVVLYLKEEYASNRNPVSVCFCHKNAAQVYSPMLIGMNYEFLLEYGVYRQTLFQVIRRAIALNCRQINFGISATIEKKRIGATPNPKVGYYQAKDNFAMEMMQATIAIEKD
jgi:hypothetical protein